MKRIFQPLLAMLLCLSLCLPVMATDNQVLAAKDVVNDIARETDSKVNIGESEAVSGDAGEETAPDEGENLPGESEEAQDHVEPIKFPFTVYLKDAKGNPLEGEYQYTGTLTGTLHNGSVVYLSDQDYIDIQNLPEGTQYEVIEGETEGYTLQSSENTTGTIGMDELSHAKFINKKIFLGPRLPETGGEGVLGIMVLGASCLVCGGLLASKKKAFQ